MNFTCTVINTISEDEFIYMKENINSDMETYKK